MAVSVDTLIFLDVDGVLNVGVNDEPNVPIAFTSGNVQLASQMAAKAKTSNIHPLAERILAVAARKLEHGENGTYEKLVAHDRGQLLPLGILLLLADAKGHQAETTAENLHCQTHGQTVHL